MEAAYIRYLHQQHCKFEEDPQTVTEIEEGVKYIVTVVLQKVAAKNSIFEISKFVEAGSFYEGTKVCQPNEFDFMVILNHLSTPGAIRIADGCSPGYKKICVEDQLEKYKKCCDGENMLHVEKIRAQFWNYLHGICEKHIFEKKLSQGLLRVKACKNRKFELEYIENALDSESPGKPESKELIHRKSIEVGIDLMLGIKYPDIKQILSGDGVPEKLKSIVAKKGCHLVVKGCQSFNPCSTCWQVSFACCEMQLMKDIGKNHKISYKVLKYLLTREVRSQGKCTGLTSYVLKNAFMFHAYEGKCEDHLSKCANDVLSYLCLSFKKHQMPCFLSRNLNTWGPIIKYPGLLEKINQEESVGTEWYAVLWLELWRKFVLKASKMLEDIEYNQFQKVEVKFAYMREYMMCLIERYALREGLHQLPLQPITLPTDVPDDELNARFRWYIKRLDEIFKTKFEEILT